MTDVVDWPTYLNPATNQEEPVPPPQWEGMQLEMQDVLLRSQMDSGPPKSRRRFTGASRYFTCYFVFTPEQAEAFEDWYYKTTQYGALKFNWITPYSNKPCVASFRKPFTMTPFSSIMRRIDGSYHYLWKYTAEIEIHP